MRNKVCDLLSHQLLLLLDNPGFERPRVFINTPTD